MLADLSALNKLLKKAVKKFKTKEAAILDRPNSEADALLQNAAYHGFLPFLEWLLSKGTDVDLAQNKDNATALFLAREGGQLLCV